MPNCNDDIPRGCSDAFADIAGKLGGMDAKLDAIHDQTTKTNGSIADLEAITTAHHDRIGKLEGATGLARTCGRWLGRVAFAVALVVLGWWLKS